MSVQGVYVAYPIDQAKDLVETFRQVDNFKRELIGGGVASWVFDPGDAFRVNPRQPIGSVREVNAFAASLADAVVAFLPEGVPTIGVPMEVDRAVQAGKLVVIFSDVESFMLEYGEGVHRQDSFTDGALLQALEWLRHSSPAIKDDSVSLPVQFLDDKGFLPTRTYEDDAGLDLYVSQSVVIQPGDFVDIPCGIAVELPEWAWAMVTGRSSALRKKGLLVQQGIIDPGYRGPMFSGVFNLTNKPVTVERGERLAQLICFINHTKGFTPVQVHQLGTTKRGDNGFGSSGS